MNKLLTIVIPTYNRERQLIRLLNSIERQKCIEKYYIVILNNHSDYDIESSINKNFTSDFLNNINIYNRPYNAGGDYNIGSSFLFAKSPFLWIIGDDDEVLDGCFDIIYDDIHHYPDVPCFKYHIEGHSTYDDDVLINSISQFRELFKKKYFSAGDIIFMSNNIFNLPKMGDYVSSTLYYSYCSVPHSLPMLRCMIDEKYFLLSHREIVKYHFPEGDHWNYTKIIVSMSTVLDIYVSDNYKATIEFFNIISKHFRIQDFLGECLKISDKSYRKHVYRRCMNSFFMKRNVKRMYYSLLYHTETLTGVGILTFHLRMLIKCKDMSETIKKQLKLSNSIIYKIYKKYKAHLKNRRK